MMSVSVNSSVRAYGMYDQVGALNRSGRVADKQSFAEAKSAAKDFGAIMQAVKDSPDLRTDKVADIKTRVEMGSYDVSSSAVANKILGGYYNRQS